MPARTSYTTKQLPCTEQLWNGWRGPMRPIPTSAGIFSRKSTSRCGAASTTLPAAVRCAPWVYQVAHNTAASHIARQRNKNASLVSLEELERVPSREDNEPAIDRSTALERLLLLIQRLKPIVSERRTSCQMKRARTRCRVSGAASRARSLEPTSRRARNMLAVLMSSAAAGYVYCGYQLRKRGPDTTGSEPSRATTATYRTQLERQRDFLRTGWRRLLLPLVPRACRVPDELPGPGTRARESSPF